MLKSIYVKNTSFFINDGELVQKEQVPEDVEKLFNKIPKFKSGQVFEVILPNSNGDLTSGDQYESRKQFLISITAQQVMINE